MGTRGRWRAWLGGYALIAVIFGLAWWNNPANIGAAREAQRLWLALAFGIVGLAIFVPPLALRASNEVVAQRTLIVALALYLSMDAWWVGFLPSDPFGCSRVEAPDCHTNELTRWRAFGEITLVWIMAFGLTHVVGRVVGRRRDARIPA